MTNFQNVAAATAAAYDGNDDGIKLLCIGSCFCYLHHRFYLIDKSIIFEADAMKYRN